MPLEPQANSADEAAITSVTAAFYRAFSNLGGIAPAIDVLYDLFLPDARIVKNVGGSPESYDLRTFVEPRRSILTDGTIREFSEEETNADTRVAGNIAHRLSTYRKSWIAGSESHAGGGVKSLQFVRTPMGWKIASLVWDDFP